MKNSLWLLNSLNFLSVDHVVGSAHLYKRQGESLTDGLPGRLWDITGLGAAVEATHWFLNDFVFPDLWPSPSNIPDTHSTNRKDPQSNLGVGPDIELNSIAPPVNNFGDDCKPVAWSGDQASIVSLIYSGRLWEFRHHLANVQSHVSPGSLPILAMLLRRK